MKFELNIKNCNLVKPEKPTWRGYQSLSELDQINGLKHVEILYIYRPSLCWLKQSNTTIPETLINSLSQALVPFYPLAGRLRSLKGGRFELNCNGNGVQFIEAELNNKLIDFGDFTPSPNFQYLLPFIDYSLPIDELPLLFVQLTKFSCGGIALSMAFSHIAIDGASMGIFITGWARIARGKPLKVVPLHDRKKALQNDLILSPCFDHSKEFVELPRLIKQNPSSKEEEEVKKIRRTVITLRLAKDQVEKLKKVANEGKINNFSNASRDFSRFEAIAAHIWRCFIKARKNKAEQLTSNLITIDCRNRLKPLLPIGYFGNAIIDQTAKCLAGDLASNPLGYGASRVREAIEKVKDEHIWSFIEYLKNEPDMNRFRHLYLSFTENNNSLGNPNVGVVNWVNLPAYGMDFGWGKEIYFGPGNQIVVDGDSVIFRSSNGDVSLVVVLCLEVDHVDDFKKLFYKDITLSSL